MNITKKDDVQNSLNIFREIDLNNSGNIDFSGLF
jgi:hypothetical protein